MCSFLGRGRGRGRGGGFLTRGDLQMRTSSAVDRSVKVVDDTPAEPTEPTRVSVSSQRGGRGRGRGSGRGRGRGRGGKVG